MSAVFVLHNRTIATTGSRAAWPRRSRKIHAAAGSQFDPELARLFVEAIEGGGLSNEAEQSPPFPVPLVQV